MEPSIKALQVVYEKLKPELWIAGHFHFYHEEKMGFSISYSFHLGDVCDDVVGGKKGLTKVIRLLWVVTTRNSHSQLAQITAVYSSS